MGYSLHETAFVSPEAKIGENTRIGHFTVVEEGAQIGENCSIGSGCFISDGAKIGNNVTICDNVAVPKGVTMQDNVYCGCGTVFAREIFPRSCPDRPRYGIRTTNVEKGASIHSNATLMNGVTVGENASVASGSVVTSSVPSHAMVVGSPAKQWGWVCECGLPLANPSLACPCGNNYALVGANPPVLMKK